ncbi:MAG: amino acid aminotransferase [Sediminibacterium sp.]|nr:amino acid aminotransferase [Sediminibacterium sp.]
MLLAGMLPFGYTKNSNMSLICYANNRWQPLQEAGVSLQDLGFNRGYAIFDFLRVAQNTPLFLQEHLDRFFQSARDMRLTIPVSREELTKIVHEIINKNQLGNSGVRITLTGGISTDGIRPGTPELFIVNQQIQTPPDEMRTDGYQLMSYPYRRHFPQVKTTDYTMEIWLRPMVEDHLANDVLYHHHGIISECPRCNFFVVNASGNLVTPDTNVLKGVTRNIIIDIAKEIGILVEMRDLHLHEIPSVREAFVSSTTKRIIPVSRMDDVFLPVNGPVTSLLYNRFLEREQAEINHVPNQ